ncbi:MAG TPA: ribonuclease Z, partial [Flavobacteriales bacterium]|nr:ribonuclease Z [Flavobacteriales bacterium]
MEAFNITILGSGSSIPTVSRNLAGQFINIRGKHYLIDCGEGTQFQLIRYKLKYQKINHIFISHLHGDHYFGLVGLLSSMHLLGRSKDLNIYGPPDLEGIINSQIGNHNKGLNFKVLFKVLGFGGQEIILDNKHITVETIKLNHRIPCNGFLIKEKARPRTLNQDAIEKYNIPIYERANIKNGADFVMESGEKVENEIMTSAPISPRSYAYCSDTAYYEAIIEQIAGVDLLYHEATFMNDRKERA